MERIILCLGLLIILSACVKQKNGKEAITSTEQLKSQRYTDDQLNRLKDNSPQMIDQLAVFGDTLDITSSGTLSYRPFGFTPFKDSLQRHFNEILNAEVLSIQDKRKTYKLSFKESFIKIDEMDSTFFPAGAEHLAEYHHQKPDLAVIKEGYIEHKHIRLIGGIHVGMKKRDFFLSVFNSWDKAFDPINTVINGDALGDYANQWYTFKQDTLSSIEFK